MRVFLVGLAAAFVTGSLTSRSSKLNGGLACRDDFSEKTEATMVLVLFLLPNTPCDD